MVHIIDYYLYVLHMVRTVRLWLSKEHKCVQTHTACVFIYLLMHSLYYVRVCVVLCVRILNYWQLVIEWYLYSRVYSYQIHRGGRDTIRCICACVHLCMFTYIIYLYTYLQYRGLHLFTKLNTYITASSRATVPAEFKHINKRRKRNQQGFP